MKPVCQVSKIWETIEDITVGATSCFQRIALVCADRMTYSGTVCLQCGLRSSASRSENDACFSRRDRNFQNCNTICCSLESRKKKDKVFVRTFFFSDRKDTRELQRMSGIKHVNSPKVTALLSNTYTHLRRSCSWMTDTTWASGESQVSVRVSFWNLDDPCSTQVE